MFAARANNENAIYEQQTTAAAKPSNQAVKGLAPKTPANKAPKTPFKVPLNDENTTLLLGKTGGKGKQDGLFGEGKSGKVDKSAFVTPAGARNRAPLGNKTTNAKATAFQTPVPATQQKLPAKHTSPRMRRARVKVHEAESTTAEDEEDQREIEYMPPREVPLPDYPDDWPHDRTYPQFEGKNLTRGWWSEFAPQKAGDGDEEFSDFEEKLKRIEELHEKKKKLAKKSAAAAGPVKKAPMQKTNRDPLAAKLGQQTLKAKSAASALSKPISSSSRPTPASAMMSNKPTNSMAALRNPRHTAAKVASNSTLGYSKGRAVSSSTRKPLEDVHGGQVTHSRNAPSTSTVDGPTKLDELFGLQDLHVSDGDADLGFERYDGFGGDDEEDAQVFQLDSVEL